MEIIFLFYSHTYNLIEITEMRGRNKQGRKTGRGTSTEQIAENGAQSKKVWINELELTVSN